MTMRISEFFWSTEAVDILASALLALPGGNDALAAAIAAVENRHSAETELIE